MTGIKTFDNIFGNTTQGIQETAKENGNVKIAIDKLVHFENHPFELYSGDRFDELVSSVRQLGIIQPIIVREKGECYEILAGHNRVEACKHIGEAEISAIIVDVDDEEAEMIMLETNMQQRSFSDLPHSEKAKIISIRHEAMKSQGKRTDLTEKVENILNNINVIEIPFTSDIGSDKTCSPVANKLKTIEKVGQEYGLSKDSIARYIRINQLPKEFIALIDKEDIAIRTGVELSYIKEENLKIIYQVLTSGDYKLDMKKAKALRKLDTENKITFTVVIGVLDGLKPKKEKEDKEKKIKIPKYLKKVFEKYFKDVNDEEEIAKIIDEALSEYFNGN